MLRRRLLLLALLLGCELIAEALVSHLGQNNVTLDEITHEMFLFWS